MQPEDVEAHLTFPLPNVWLGTSAENQATLTERWPHLQRCPAAVRLLSLEPMLEEVSLTLMRHDNDWDPPSVPEGINLVIVGGESGPKARPFNLAWARNVRDQCKAAGVPLFFKQAGSRPYLVDRRGNIGFRGKAKYGLGLPDGFYRHLNDRKGGDPGEWPEDLRVREWPKGGEV